MNYKMDTVQRAAISLSGFAELAQYFGEMADYFLAAGGSIRSVLGIVGKHPRDEQDENALRR